MGLALPASARPTSATNSARERAQSVATGPWNGTWSLQRDDPRIRTLAGTATPRLQIIHDAAGRVELQWIADRGICEDPNAAPCEWAGARVTGLAVAAGRGALAVLLCISADPDHPFLLVERRSGDGCATARLVSEKRGIAYRQDVERE